MAPRVLIDATAVPANRGGVGRYVDGLIGALGDADAGFAIACQRADVERYAQLAPRAQVVSGPPAIAHRSDRLAWEQTGLPRVAEAMRADVVHSPYYTMPLHLPQPVVVTIHDVTYFTARNLHAPAVGDFYRSAIRTAAHRGRRCIVPSQATAAELARLFHVDPAMIDVVYHGVDTQVFRRPSKADRLRVSSRLGLRGRPYIAFLGELTRRKNVPNLIRAYVTAAADVPDPPALVLAGSSGWDDEVYQAASQVPSQLRVVRPGYLRIADLPGFLGGALVVAYPSQAEGFGLPVLEAMACGVPVLTTPWLSLPEVGGDAVAYTEPDVASLAVALSELLQNSSRRSSLAKAGAARAREFTWAASVQAHLAAYARAAAGE